MPVPTFLEPITTPQSIKLLSDTPDRPETTGGKQAAQNDVNTTEIPSLTEPPASFSPSRLPMLSHQPCRPRDRDRPNRRNSVLAAISNRNSQDKST